MKTLRRIWMLPLLLAAVSITMTSCLDDDDDDTANELTQQEKSFMASAMQGQYDGYVYFDNDSTYRTDSTAVTFQMTAIDSVLLCPRLPVSILSNVVSSPQAKTILKAATPQPFRATIHFYYNENKGQGIYTYMMLPTSTLSYSVNLEGVQHNVIVTLAASNTIYNRYGQQGLMYAYGAYRQNEVSAYILPSKIKIDNTDYPCSSAIILYGKK